VCCGKIDLAESGVEWTRSGKVNRRRFLKALGLAVGVTALSGCGPVLREIEKIEPDSKKRFAALAKADDKIGELKRRLEAKGHRANLSATRVFDIQGIRVNVIPFEPNATLAYMQHDGMTLANAKIDLTRQVRKIIVLEPGELDYEVRLLQGREREKILRVLYEHPKYG